MLAYDNGHFSAVVTMKPPKQAKPSSHEGMVRFSHCPSPQLEKNICVLRYYLTALKSILRMSILSPIILNVVVKQFWLSGS